MRSMHGGVWRDMQKCTEGCMVVYEGVQICAEGCRGAWRCIEGHRGT